MRLRSLGQVLQQARLAAGMSTKTFAEATGLAHGVMSQIETGRRDIDLEVVSRMPVEIRAVVAKALVEEYQRHIVELRTFYEGGK